MICNTHYLFVSGFEIVFKYEILKLDEDNI